MTGTQTLIARAALGAAGAVASITVTRWRRVQLLSERKFDYGIVITLALSRIFLFGTLFGLLHLAPRGDIPGFYYPQAVAVLQGHLPYRNFPSSYAPLHPYLDALFISIWRTPLAIIFASIAAESLLLPIWLRVARELFTDKTVRLAALLYSASPISLQFVSVDGQDNVLIALLLAAAMLFALRSRALLSGIFFGLSAVLIKFLPLLFAPAFLIAGPRRLRWAAGTFVVLVAVYGGALLLHLPILQPLKAEGAMRSAGNLPYLAESALGVTIPSSWSNALLLLALGAIVLATLSSARRMPTIGKMRALTFCMPALTLALLLFSKKSWPPYLMLSLFPLCLVVAEQRTHPRWMLALFALFNLAAVTEHSVWSSLLLEASSAKLHDALLAGDRIADVFIALHTALLAGYLWLLVLSIRALSAPYKTGKAL